MKERRTGEERLEIRWIVAGDLLDVLADRRGDFAESAERVDLYAPPVHEAMNIKHRGPAERLDVKIRTGGDEISTKRWSGELETWVRYALAPSEELSEPPADWIRLEKRRHRTHFAVRSSLKATALAPLDEPVVSLEMTELRVLSHRAWSVAAECWLVDEPTPVIDQALAEFGIAKACEGLLDTERSLSYPTWLFRLGLDAATDV